MQTDTSLEIQAPIARIFELGAFVEHWPDFLPHYRYVRLFDDQATSYGRRRIVEMAASRDWIPVSWISIQEHHPAENRIVFKHIQGWTKGMDVEWRLEPRGDKVRVTIHHDFVPPWPIIGPWAARVIVGEFFIDNIARKTLRCIRDRAEREAALAPVR
jgi:ribosome-associated toxin RatA of RatAB toxin-antitoxin module